MKKTKTEGELSFEFGSLKNAVLTQGLMLIDANIILDDNDLYKYIVTYNVGSAPPPYEIELPLSTTTKPGDWIIVVNAVGAEVVPNSNDNINMIGIGPLADGIGVASSDVFAVAKFISDGLDGWFAEYVSGTWTEIGDPTNITRFNASVPGGTTDNLVSLDANDVIADSGISVAGSSLSVPNNITFGGQSNTPIYTLTDGATITPNWDDGSIQEVTLDGNRTIANPTNKKEGATYILFIKQDSVTGSRTLTWGTDFKWSGGTAPTLSTGTDEVDIISFICDGTNMYGSLLPNFS